MQSSPDLHLKLKSALKEQEEQKTRRSADMLSAANASAQVAKPSIMLKMDFSNFKS